MTPPRKRIMPANLLTARTLEANELRDIRGGETEVTLSNVLKTRHDTVKNTISN